MTKKMATGMGIGIAAAGAAALAAGMSKGMKNRSSVKRKAKNAMRSVEGFMGDMRYMFR